MMEPRTEAGRRLAEQLRRLPPAWGHVEAILAIEDEAAASPVLDVERLARAIFQTELVGEWATSFATMKVAERIAAEYAALAPSPDPGFKLSDYDPETEGRGGT